MSWIVETLLRNRETIKSDMDIESDAYNDLLFIEKKISELYEKGFLSDFDVLILKSVGGGGSLTALERVLNKNRITISKTFTQLCERLSYFLGGYFTDDGFLEDVKSRYRLSEEEVEILANYTKSKFRHKLIRKGLIDD